MNNNEGQIMDQGKTSRDSKNSMITMGNNSNENNSSRNKFRKDISPVKNNCNKENNNYHKQDQQQ